MRLFSGRGPARAARDPAGSQSLERQVTMLQATLAACKTIGQRRRYWLEATVAALVVVTGLLIYVSRQTLEPAIGDLVPVLRAGTPIPSVDAAYAAYQSGDYGTAQELSRSRAEHGDARAQSLLGLMYYAGRGVLKDEREALTWFNRAADQGDAAAQLQLGIMYSDGRGVPQDYAEAAKWYQRAADKNTPEAQYNLGILYAYGRGVPQDNMLAHMWFNRAAALFTTPAARRRAADNRDIIARRMSPSEVARAQELARTKEVAR